MGPFEKETVILQPLILGDMLVTVDGRNPTPPWMYQTL